MTDNELLNIIIDDLYRNVSCENIVIMLNEKYKINIDREHARLLCRMAVATGYVEELSISCGPHWVIKITQEGIRMIMEYGTYSNFLSSKTSNTIKQAKDAAQRNREIKIRIIHIIVTIIVSIAATAATIFTIFQNDKITKLEELLHKNNIEIPK